MYFNYLIILLSVAHISLVSTLENVEPLQPGIEIITTRIESELDANRINLNEVNEIIESADSTTIKIDDIERYEKEDMVIRMDDNRITTIQPDDKILKESKSTSGDIIDTVQAIVQQVDDERNGTDNDQERSDRTIVVVVTTNIIQTNSYPDQTTDMSKSKIQHSELSFGNPFFLLNETDRRLMEKIDQSIDLHNKITSNYFNDNELIPTSTVRTTEPPSTRRGILKNIASAIINTLENYVGDKGRSLDNPDISNDENNLVPTVRNDRFEDNVNSKMDSEDSALIESFEKILDPEVQNKFAEEIPILTEYLEEERDRLKDLHGYVIEEIPIEQNHRELEIKSTKPEIGQIIMDTDPNPKLLIYTNPEPNQPISPDNIIKTEEAIIEYTTDIRLPKEIKIGASISDEQPLNIRPTTDTTLEKIHEIEIEMLTTKSYDFIVESFDYQTTIPTLVIPIKFDSEVVETVNNGIDVTTGLYLEPDGSGDEDMGTTQLVINYKVDTTPFDDNINELTYTDSLIIDPTQDPLIALYSGEIITVQDDKLSTSESVIQELTTTAQEKADVTDTSGNNSPAYSKSDLNQETVTDNKYNEVNPPPLQSGISLIKNIFGTESVENKLQVKNEPTDDRINFMEEDLIEVQKPIKQNLSKKTGDTSVSHSPDSKSKLNLENLETVKDIKYNEPTLDKNERTVEIVTGPPRKIDDRINFVEEDPIVVKPTKQNLLEKKASESSEEKLNRKIPTLYNILSHSSDSSDEDQQIEKLKKKQETKRKKLKEKDSDSDSEEEEEEDEEDEDSSDEIDEETKFKKLTSLFKNSSPKEGSEKLTETHKIIKKYGVPKTEATGRSFDATNDNPSLIRTIVEGVDLTADITKTYDNFRGPTAENSSFLHSTSEIIASKSIRDMVDVGVSNELIKTIYNRDNQTSESMNHLNNIQNQIAITTGCIAFAFLVIASILVTLHKTMFRQLRANFQPSNEIP